jgi:hypothetical protein
VKQYVAKKCLILFSNLNNSVKINPKNLNNAIIKVFFSFVKFLQKKIKKLKKNLTLAFFKNGNFFKLDCRLEQCHPYGQKKL